MARQPSVHGRNTGAGPWADHVEFPASRCSAFRSCSSPLHLSPGRRRARSRDASSTRSGPSCRAPPSRLRARTCRGPGPRPRVPTGPIESRPCRPVSIGFGRACRASARSKSVRRSASTRRRRPTSRSSRRRASRWSSRARRRSWTRPPRRREPTTTRKVIDKLPIDRNYADVVFLQPGVQADFGETQGRSLAISIYGSTSAENLFLIDGVNTTNVIKGVPGQGHQQRVRAGSRGEDGRLPGRVRPQHGRRDQRHHQVGWQRAPRRSVRLLQRHRHARRPEERGNHELCDARLLRDRRRTVRQFDPVQGRAPGVGRGSRRLRHQGQDLVLRRLRPCPGEPKHPDAGCQEPRDFRQRVSLRHRPEQVLRQADPEPDLWHERRRDRLLRRSDAGGRPPSAVEQ